VPFLGGQPKLLIDDAWTPVDWSPDARHLAFVREDRATGAASVITADPDGALERAVVTYRRPLLIFSLFLTARPNVRPAWSPDRRSIAFAVMDQTSGATRFRIDVADVVTGATKAVSVGSAVPIIQSLAWLNSDEIIVNEAIDGNAPEQLWRLNYRDERLSRLTNDINDYQGISLTADRQQLVTTRSETRTDIWVGDAAAKAGADAVPPEVSSGGSVRWLGDRILYDTNVGGISAVMIVTPDRGTRREVISQGLNPIATSDGRTIVFESSERGARAGLWKIDADGQRPVHLMTGDVGVVSLQALTPDGRTAMFTSMKSGQQSLWAMAVDGGSPYLVLRDFVGPAADLTPDGKSIAFGSLDERARANILVACDFPACRSRQIFRTVTRALRWTPDGSAIAYTDTGRMNIWVQPMKEDAKPYQLTHFSDRSIVDFAWSHDGKQLAISRSATINDIVMFKGLQR
jgi:Tol biopolymer transport system component